MVEIRKNSVKEAKATEQYPKFYPKLLKASDLAKGVLLATHFLKDSI
jgi:hypothetical protein